MYYGILAFGLSAVSFSWVGVVVAIIAALLPDADEENSLINARNPVIGTASFIVRISAFLAKWAVGFGFFWLVGRITGPLVEGFRPGTGHGWERICFFLGCTSPIIGYLVPGLEKAYGLIDGSARLACRFIWTAFYVAVACYGLYIAYKGNLCGLALAALCLGAVLFRHRTVLHAPEGFLLSVLTAAGFFTSLGHSELVWAFAIGYGSHLYLADLFTDTGVPVSGVPVILDRLKVRSRLLETNWYPKLDELLTRKISLPLMRTGTPSGNLFEGGYLMILVVAGFAIKHYIP